MLRNSFDRIFKRVRAEIFQGSTSPHMAEKYNDHGIELPIDVWIEILLRIDDQTLFQCRLVNRIWNENLNSSSFWLKKCQNVGVTLPSPNMTTKIFDYRRIYFKKPFGRNFIKNPSGEDGLDRQRGINHWNVVQGGGEGFRIENPPNGSDTEGFPVCFATSYGSCVKEQLIDLRKEGCDVWILDELQPKIVVSEWHAARWDCASTYKLYVALLKNIPTDNPAADAGNNDWYGTNRDDNSPYLRADPQNVITEFFKTTTVEQWLGRAWQETCHTFENYGPGVRYVLFQTYGKDRQFWAGHYGPKMAKASVELNI